MHRNAQNEHTPNLYRLLFRGEQFGHQVAEKQCWMTLKVLDEAPTTCNKPTFSSVP